MKRIEMPIPHISPEADEQSKIRDVLRASLGARDGFASELTQIERIGAYWNAAHFGLNRVSFYRGASPELQAEILSTASRHTLEEAYFIELTGICFTAKMVLLAPTAQERMLYGLFSADETVHMNHVLSFLPNVPKATGEPGFLSMLSESIQNGSRESLIFLIQVVLEGWGMTHYHQLAENCLDPKLKKSLRLILKDEARHHGSGMILNRELSFGQTERDFLRETLHSFFQMVQFGPQNILAALEQGLGHLSRAQKIQVFEELDAQSRTSEKLEVLRGLLVQGRATEQLQFLEKAGVLRPMNAQECA